MKKKFKYIYNFIIYIMKQKIISTILIISIILLFIFVLDESFWAFIGVALFTTIWLIATIIYNIASSIGVNINYNLVYIVYAIIIISTLILLVKLNRIMKRKNLLLLCFGVTLFCAIFVRIVPDYSTDFGIRPTTIFGYNKYKKGYCLSEDRILSKEERYKRGIIDYFNKKLIVDKMMFDVVCDFFGTSDIACNFGSKELAVDIGYYSSDKINSKNWFEVISDEINKTKDIKFPIRKIMMEDFNITKTKLKKEDIIVNLEKRYAGLREPIVYYSGSAYYELYLDKSILLGKKVTFSPNTFVISHPREYGYNFEDLKGFYEKDALNEYYRKRGYKIDNCGNVDISIRETFRKEKENIGKGV